MTPRHDMLNRRLDPALYQRMLLDSLDLKSGAWADLYSDTLEQHGVTWEQALDLHRELTGDA